MSNWAVPRMWSEGECWIIGGGISMPRQFGIPEPIIEQVMAKEKPLSVYSKYLTSLHSPHVIACNVAYLLGSWISAVIFCDLPFYRNNKYQLMDFKSLKVTDAGNIPEDEVHIHKNIKKLRRDNRPGLSQHPDVIRWNKSTGGGAINLATLLGVKRILLLGFDFKPDEKGRTHWHAGLPAYEKPTEKRSFDHFLTQMPQVARDAEDLGIEILNVNPDSRLDVFPKVELKDVL